MCLRPGQRSPPRVMLSTPDNVLYPPSTDGAIGPTIRRLPQGETGGGPRPLVRERPDAIIARPWRGLPGAGSSGAVLGRSANTNWTAPALPLSITSHRAQVAQSCQVFQHWLQQGLGNGKLSCQFLVAVDAALRHQSQQVFQHDQNALAT